VIVVTKAPQNILPPPPKTIQSHEIINIIVVGESDLSGDYTVNAAGEITMPLVGAVNIAGKTLDQATEIITKAYAQGYLVSPVIQISQKTQCPCPSPESIKP
jgi:polysaccharide export outer membrane protein